MKTYLLLLVTFITSVQSATAALVTRNVNIPFIHNSINVDVDNDGLNEFYIDINMELGLPVYVAGPPCEYNEYSPQVLVMVATASSAPGPHYGTVTNDVSNIPGITGMVQVPGGYIPQATYSHIRLGTYRQYYPVSGTCTPATAQLDSYAGFLDDTTTTTNTYFAFNIKFSDGTYHYGYLEFTGYHITKIVYDDVATAIGVSAGDDNISIENDQEGNVSITANEQIEKVLVSDLTGRSEEFNSANFHTTKKGWVVIQITTTSGLYRRRMFVQ